MRFIVLLATSMVLFTSCHESEVSIEVTQTRRLTYFDQDSPGNILDNPPLGWRTIPATQFRDRNFVAGPEEKVEIYVSNANGSVLANANRWLEQFGLSPVQDLSTFGTIDMLGRVTFLVDAEGTFNPGRGGATKEGYGLVGALRQTNGGLLTVKMVGPAGEVAKIRPEFVTYCESMRIMDVTTIKEDEPETTAPESEEETEVSQ